jgi:hypothetical protein
MKVLSMPCLMVAMSLSMGISSTAFAQGFLGGLVQDTLHVTGSAINGATNVVVGTVDAVGNVVDSGGRLIGRVAMPGSPDVQVPSETVVMLGTTNDVYGYAIDARRGDLRRAVALAVSRGMIGQMQAVDLQTALDRTAANQATGQGDRVLTFEKSIALARDLDDINVRLAAAMSVRPYDSLLATDSSGTTRMFVTTPRTLSSDVATSQTRSVTQDGITTTTTTTSRSSNPSSREVAIGTEGLSNSALLAVLDARRFQLDRMVSDGMERRVFQGDSALKMQSDLDGFRTRLVRLQAPGTTFSQDQAVLMARELDTMDGNVALAMRVNAWSPLTVVDSGTGTTKIVTDQFMNVIGTQDAGAELYTSTLQARRSELEGVIARQEASGALARARANDLRSDLDRVAKQQAQQREAFGYADALPLAVTLDYVGNEIHKVIPTFGYVPLIDDSRFVVAGGRVVLVDDVMVRRAELQSRIAREYAIGSISEDEHRSLRKEMKTLADDEEQLRTRGSLTVKGSRDLYQGFDKVAAHLDGYKAGSKRSPISNR